MTPNSRLQGLKTLSRRRAETIAFVGLGLLHLVYTFAVSSPLVQADETGHLLKAAAIAGYTTQGPTPYGIGFPVLISPLFMIFDDPGRIYRFVLIVNAVLATATAWVVYRFLLNWKGRDQNWRAALFASMAAAAYPASFAYTTSAQAEALLTLVIASLLLANLRLAVSNGRGWVSVVFSAAMTGIVVIVHQRGGPTAILSAVFVFFILFRARRIDALAVWLTLAAGLAGAGLWMGRLIQSRLTLASYSDISSYSDSSYHLMSKIELFSGFRGILSGLGRLVLMGTGQLSYLVAATFGLVVVGALAMAKRTGSGMPVPSRAFGAFGLVLLATNLAMSVVAIFPGARIDQIIYGRYNEAVIPVFLAIGLLELTRTGTRIALSAFVTALAALVLILTTMPEGAFLQDNLQNIMSLYWFVLLFDRYGGFLAIAAGIVAIIPYLFARRRSTIVILAIFVFVINSVVLATSFLKPSSDGRASQRRIAEYVRANIKPGTCLTQHLTRDMSAWARWNTKFYLFNYPLREETRIEEGRICSPWVISADPDFQNSHPAAVMVQREHMHPQRLWYLGPDTHSLRYSNEVTAGRRIVFAGNPASVDFLGSGWGETESWGVWMVGPQASIDLRIPEGARGYCRMRLRGKWFLKGPRPQARVEVKLGHGPVATFEGRLPDKRFDWSFAFAARDAAERRIIIDIRAENPQSMQELGLGNDTRQLSIGLVDLLFQGCDS